MPAQAKSNNRISPVLLEWYLYHFFFNSFKSVTLIGILNFSKNMCIVLAVSLGSSSIMQCPTAFGKQISLNYLFHKADVHVDLVVAILRSFQTLDSPGFPEKLSNSKFKNILS